MINYGTKLQDESIMQYLQLTTYSTHKETLHYIQMESISIGKLATEMI